MHKSLAFDIINYAVPVSKFGIFGKEKAKY